MEILVATKNAGKVKEIENLLERLPIRLRSLNDFPALAEPAETGATFAENARLKAVYYGRETGLLALADDSGLEVDALGGAPGVFSARFAGERATDADNLALLLNRLAMIKNAARKARFVCAMALADANGAVEFQTEGVCAGEIIENPRGANGFGYDPIFVPEGCAETFAELSPVEKQKISHRGRAAREIIRFLQYFIAL